MFKFLDSLGNKIKVGDQIQYYSKRIKGMKHGFVDKLVYQESQGRCHYGGNYSNVTAYVRVYIPGEMDEFGNNLKEARWNIIRNFSLTAQVIK